MGRPPIGPVVLVRIPPDVIARLDAQAERKNITRAELLRRIATEWLEENE